MLLLQGSAIAPIILIKGLSTRECQRQGVQEVYISEGKRACMTCLDGCMLSDLGLMLHSVLCGTGRALPGASTHGHLFFGPIDLGIMLSEPHEPKDHVLPSQAGDGKYGMLCMIPIAENQVNHGANCAGFVGHSVNVVDRNGLGKGLHGQAIAFDKLQV
ncbi:hypothetical protein C0989_007968 [Termitomyces sp. Mn162]|nr:hypothetical protein C0989_007968 [Termitomyces sp. Mn162]